VCGQLARQQEAGEDGALLLLGVARQPDHLHPVQQGPGNGLCGVGGRDEQYVRQVEGKIQVAVPERQILLRIQHLEQHRAGVAADSRSDFVHLIEHEDGIVDARPP